MQRNSELPKGVSLYDVNNEPIVLSKSLLDILLNEKESHYLIALYCFYYYTAKWQKTNQPKVTNGYVTKKLQWGIPKIIKTKTKLIELNLIENVVTRNEKNQISGHYIKVNFIWSNEKATLCNSHTVENENTNALSTNSKNIYREFLGFFPKDYQENDLFQKSLRRFVAHRKEKKQPLTSHSQKIAFNKLKQYSVEICIEAFNRSIENGWSGVFPESIKMKPSIKIIEPSKLISDYFTTAYSKTFINYYRGAEELLESKTKITCSELAQNMLGLYKWIEVHQTESALKQDAPTPGVVIRDYIEWISEQNWFNVTPSIFQESKVFKRFLMDENKEIGFDILTGK